jgi:hypothetical protein
VKNSRVISGKFKCTSGNYRNVTLNCTFMTLHFLLASPTVRRNSIWLFLISQTNRRTRNEENRIIFDQTAADSPEGKQHTRLNQ